MTGAAGGSGSEGYLGAGARPGIRGWIFSTDHKRVGVLYLTSLLGFFMVAMAIGVLMRVEQLTMGAHRSWGRSPTTPSSRCTA